MSTIVQSIYKGELFEKTAELLFDDRYQQQSSSHNDDDDDGSMTFLRKKVKKSVRFHNVTVYSFVRTQGFSSVPSQDGPTLGMDYRHVCIETYDLSHNDLDLTEACICDRNETTETQRNNSCPNDINHCAQWSNGVPTLSDRLNLRQRFPNGRVSQKGQRVVVGNAMQPLLQRQRRSLLIAAGVTIDRTEIKETQNIRNSRLFCGCLCQVICNPETCSCSLSEVSCQVDRDSFPCGCSVNGCGNLTGRSQFDRSRVHLHRLTRLTQVERTLDRKFAMMEALNLEPVGSASKHRKPATRKQGAGVTRSYPKKRTSKKKLLSETESGAVPVQPTAAVTLVMNCEEVINTMNAAFSFNENLSGNLLVGDHNLTNGEIPTEGDFLINDRGASEFTKLHSRDQNRPEIESNERPGNDLGMVVLEKPEDIVHENNFDGDLRQSESGCDVSRSTDNLEQSPRSVVEIRDLDSETQNSVPDSEFRGEIPEFKGRLEIDPTNISIDQSKDKTVPFFDLICFGSLGADLVREGHEVVFHGTDLEAAAEFSNDIAAEIKPSSQLINGLEDSSVFADTGSGEPVFVEPVFGDSRLAIEDAPPLPNPASDATAATL